MSRKRQTRNGTSEPIITPERLCHGPVELAPATIADSAGRPSRPYRAIDTLTIMERRGSVTAGMRQAGEDFRHRFALAQLDPLRALDLSRLSLGGIASPAGSCLWHVVGWERSLKEWAQEQGWAGRRVSQRRHPAF